MFEVFKLGKINAHILENEFGRITTDEVVVTNERLEHIRVRHPLDYDFFYQIWCRNGS